MSEPIIEAKQNGPYLVQGPLKLIDPSGKETVIDRPWVALCRCGQSNNKPFCDGAHSRVGFKADAGKFYKPA
jgi:CDGSH-type Zn-finger protein